MPGLPLLNIADGVSFTLRCPMRSSKSLMECDGDLPELGVIMCLLSIFLPVMPKGRARVRLRQRFAFK